MAEKQYFGFIRAKEDRFGDVMEVGLRREELERMIGLCDDRGWCNVTIRNRREHGSKGQTHTMCWLPPKQPAGVPTAAPVAPPSAPEMATDNIPF